MKHEQAKRTCTHTDTHKQTHALLIEDDAVLYTRHIDELDFLHKRWNGTRLGPAHNSDHQHQKRSDLLPADDLSQLRPMQPLHCGRIDDEGHSGTSSVSSRERLLSR